MAPKLWASQKHSGRDLPRPAWGPSALCCGLSAGPSSHEPVKRQFKYQIDLMISGGDKEKTYESSHTCEIRPEIRRPRMFLATHSQEESSEPQSGPPFSPPSHPPPALHLLHHVPSPPPTPPSTLVCRLRPHIHQVTTDSLLPHSHRLLI